MGNPNFAKEISVGKKIKKARNSQKMTLKSIANETGLSIDYLKDIESGMGRLKN